MQNNLVSFLVIFKFTFSEAHQAEPPPNTPHALAAVIYYLLELEAVLPRHPTWGILWQTQMIQTCESADSLAAHLRGSGFSTTQSPDEFLGNFLRAFAYALGKDRTGPPPPIPGGTDDFLRTLEDCVKQMRDSVPPVRQGSERRRAQAAKLRDWYLGKLCDCEREFVNIASAAEAAAAQLLAPVESSSALPPEPPTVEQQNQ